MKNDNADVWPWKNIELTLQTHGSAVVAYRLQHLASGKSYVGVLTDAYRGLSVVGTRLARGSFPNAELQGLVAAAPACELHLLLTDRRLPDEDRLKLAKDAAKRWRRELGSLCINNTAKPKKSYRAPAAERPLSGHKLPSGGQMLRKHPDHKVPASDFLHQAWFGGGL